MTTPAIPHTVTITATDGNTDAPITDLVLYCTIVVPRKNDYDCDYKITDAAGQVRYTYQELASTIEAHKEICPMDYASDLDDTFALDICVPDSDGIDGLLAARTLWGIGSPQRKLTPEQEAALRSSANHRYKQARERVKRYAFRPNLEMRIEALPLASAPQKPAG